MDAFAPVIETVLDHVLEALEEQANVALEFRSQLEEMKTRLDMMRSFLADTDNLRTKKKLLKTTLIKMRNIVYEADDILTDCLLRDEYRKGGLLSCSSLSEPFFRYLTGKKLRDINLRMKKIEKSLGMYLSAQHSINEDSLDTDGRRFISSQDLNSSEAIGLEDDMRKMKGWMLCRNDGQLQKIGIVGMGGLGKTTIGHKLFNDREVGCHFDKRIWLSVSQTFSENNILRSVLKQLGEDGSGLDRAQMFHRIHQLLIDKTCLIVLDDVWSTNLEWWNEFCRGIPVPSGESSCLIVTTRIEEVANSIGVDSAQIHRPKILNADESWLLFCNYAFPRSRGQCPDVHFEKLGRDIVEKCGGLPLAIKTIGGLLASKRHSYGEWKKIEENFHEELVKLGSSGSIMASLQLSYADLPSKLKQCLLCLSIYPEDAVIDAEQLIRWWVGEGLIHGEVSRTASEVGYEYLLELTGRCLVEVEKRRGYDGRVYGCRMHDMVRELTIMIAEDEGFCSFDEKGRQILSAESRWLGLTNQFNKKLLKKHPKLKALILLSTNHAIRFDRNMALLKSLRVLDLSHIKLANETEVEGLWDWISLLERLAYLNLSGVSGLKELPHSIRKLRNLQMLVLTDCNNLSMVHESLITLRRLVVLDLGSCRVQYLPQGLGQLSSLEELSGFRIVSLANKSCCRFSELKQLAQLRVLRINLSDESAISEDEFTVLSQLHKLKVLAINTDECSSSEKNKELRDDHILNMLDKLSPPPSLEELYLKCYNRETLWGWINPAALPNLQYLCIEDGNLVHLGNQESDSVNGSSWKIEGLCLKFLPRLDVQWDSLKEEMPLLHYVEVSRCYNLKGFPRPVDRPGVWNKYEDERN